MSNPVRQQGPDRRPGHGVSMPSTRANPVPVPGGRIARPSAGWKGRATSFCRRGGCHSNATLRRRYSVPHSKKTHTLEPLTESNRRPSPYHVSLCGSVAPGRAADLPERKHRQALTGADEPTRALFATQSATQIDLATPPERRHVLSTIRYTVSMEPDTAGALLRQARSSPMTADSTLDEVFWSAPGRDRPGWRPRRCSLPG